ncbi:hypothetical protein [Pseudomonas sp.]|uniref:hypothetical protein n=1 Tax=Pseudomonas sp. TaxID=306 RepID=UPI00273021DF|nr:hypothetical protein [Pseudomonas sp.]MDP2244732.1 hypothetical protein [Pseudomonas sp.]
MSDVDLVRFSRDGDHFHYYWAARQCLKLLDTTTDLVAVTIEGPSSKEGDEDAVEAGAELIDVGLYFKSEDLAEARLIQYIQLKHSTTHACTPWTGSGLKKTITGFASRYVKLRLQLQIGELKKTVQFQFLTNRPIATDVLETLADLAAGHEPRHKAVATLLTGYSGLLGDQIQTFFQLFTAKGGEPGLWDQRNLLSVDTSVFLSDPDADAAVQLKDLVSRRASSEGQSDPSIRKEDVLRAFKVDMDQLFPAPCQITTPDFELAREQDAQILQIVLQATSPVVVHADGGIGKSMLARRLSASVPADAIALVYDCYGDGLYRNALNLRHRHLDALVQVANELAAHGLCHPLIPTSHADVKLLMRAFRGRLVQAASLLRARSSTAVLCIIIDAADNAGMAAEELHERCFVGDLIGMELPDGVRLVFTSRTHRLHYLRVPSSAIKVMLEPFSEQETTRHLRHFYQGATSRDVAEFALLSSSNPRVQAIALDQRLTLKDMLKLLGPTPTTVDRTISELLARAIEQLREHVGVIEAEQIDVICRCLAVLRPLIPIPVLAKMAGTTEAAIRNFALDLRRPLLVKGDSLHFLDEPSETWFRENFKPDTHELEVLLQRMRPLTAHSAYAAAVLPQLLLQAGKLDELVELALAGDDLPTDNPLARRDVELQRLSFALKACLSSKRYKAAAKLALRAGGESAAESRQNELVQENTDLAAYLLPADRIEEIVSRRSFRSTWMGSSQAYYAGLLSGRPELRTDAASRLRIATDWLMAWARRAKEDNDSPERFHVTDADRAELTLTYLRVNGADSAADFLRQWTPKSLALEAGRSVTARLLDQRDTSAVDALFASAGNNVWLLLGVALESAKVGHSLDTKPLKRLLRLLDNRRVFLEIEGTRGTHWDLLSAVTATIEIALKILPADAPRWSQILERYLPSTPPWGLVEQHGGVLSAVLRAYALHAELSGKALTLHALAPQSISEFVSLDGKAVNHNSKAESFCRDVGGVLDWFTLGASATYEHGTISIEAAAEAALMKLSLAETYRYYGGKSLTQSVATEWLFVLRVSRLTAGAPWSQYESWLETVKEALWPITLIAICRLAAHIRDLCDFAFKMATYTYQRIENLTGDDAESRVQNYQELARAILPLSKEEASAYFDRAIEIASRIGQENLSRWNALINLGKAAGAPDNPQPELAYKLARAAELTYSYSEDHFDWRGTVDALGRLCAPSLLAIASRWRDRRFGHQEFLVSHTIEKLIELGQLPEKAAVVMGGLDAQWDRVAILSRTLDNEPTLDGRRRLLATAYRYIRLQSNNKATWRKLRALGEQLSVELLDIDRLVLFGSDDIEKDGSIHLPCNRSNAEIERRESSQEDWRVQLDNARLDDAGVLKEIFERSKQSGNSLSYAVFVDEGLRRAGLGGAAAFLKAVSSWGDFDLYNLRSLLDAVPPPYKELSSVRLAIKAAVLTVCKREPSRITRRGDWVFLPLEQLDEEGIVPDAEVVAAILNGSVDQVQDAGADELFRLLEPLATTLSPIEAAECLDYGIDLLQEALVDDKGDGVWTEALRPPTSVLSALGGYIWSGLGSPIAAERWQFAHVVCNAVEVQWDNLLDELALRATTRIAGSFSDHRLEFYSWHARQWLLVGLARGALARKGLPTSCITLLRQELKARHVLIRAFAAQALVAVEAAQTVEDKTAFLATNLSQLSEVTTVSYRNGVETVTNRDRHNAGEKDYSFGIDIGPYWFEPLGRCFNLSQASVELKAREAIENQIFAGDFSWSRDERYSRGIFGQHENGTHHRHGSNPRVDNLQAYCSYHAMMLVAADLLEERSTVRDDGESENRFQEWLARHLLTRENGMWLADLRDPQLASEPPLPSDYLPNDWYWGVTKDDLDRQLLTDDNRLVVWGAWGVGRTGDDEDISVQSAFTEAALAPALVAALQTTTSDRFYLPAADDHRYDEDNLLPLIGWINRYSPYVQIDEMDPWSQGISYPAPGPDDDTCRELALDISEDERQWTVANGGSLRSESWTRVVGYGRDETALWGRRLSADNAFVEALLESKPGHCIVLCVEIRRRLDRHAAERDGLEQYPWPYRRYYLLDRNGITRTL